MALDFDLAVAHLGSWVDAQRAETVTTGSGRNRQTRPKHSIEMILGLLPDSPAELKPLSTGLSSRLGAIVDEGSG